MSSVTTTTRQLIVSPIYSRILSHFPQNFTFCFAYGSGVKKQQQSKQNTNHPNTTANMIDLIYCVDRPEQWHETNLRDNSHHYSALKYFGASAIAQFQRNFGARVYYNTLVPLEGATNTTINTISSKGGGGGFVSYIEPIMYKYGVIATSDLVTDLLEWSDLYVAGRLHKPVEIVRKPTSPELETALQLNLQSAVHATLLLLPDTFTEYEFYYTVSNLSYAGDFRMSLFGENKDKVANIVRPQVAAFRRLYTPFLAQMHDYVDIGGAAAVSNTKDNTNNLGGEDKGTAVCCQDTSPSTRLHHLNQLPRWPQKALTRFWNRGNLRQDTEDVLRAIAYDADCSQIVGQCIGEVVWRSSVRQSLKGVLTAGLVKAVKYSGRKIGKMF